MMKKLGAILNRDFDKNLNIKMINIKENKMLETKKFELEETFDKEIYIKGVQALKAQVDELNAELPDGFTVYVNVEEDAYDDMDIADEDFITVEIWCDEIAEYNDLYTGLLDVCEIRDDGTSDFDIEGILAYFDELGIFDEEDPQEAQFKFDKNQFVSWC